MPVTIDEVTVDVTEQPTTRGEDSTAATSSEQASLSTKEQQEAAMRWRAEIRLRTSAQGFDD